MSFNKDTGRDILDYTCIAVFSLVASWLAGFALAKLDLSDAIIGSVIGVLGVFIVTWFSNRLEKKRHEELMIVHKQDEGKKTRSSYTILMAQLRRLNNRSQDLTSTHIDKMYLPKNHEDYPDVKPHHNRRQNFYKYGNNQLDSITDFMADASYHLENIDPDKASYIFTEMDKIETYIHDLYTSDKGSRLDYKTSTDDICRFIGCSIRSILSDGQNMGNLSDETRVENSKSVTAQDSKKPHPKPSKK